MSCSSDSEEFFDAEDDPHLKSRKAKLSNGLTPSLSDTDFQSTSKREDNLSSSTAPIRVPSASSLAVNNNEPVVLERLQASRSRLKELRHRMQTEDEEPVTIAGNSPTGSQTSSLDGVFTDLETRSSHPFRIIEHDALSLHSLTSLGRVTRVIGSTHEMGVTVGGEAEPDVIASTKPAPPPVPPPRTKRKNRLRPPPDSLPLNPPPPQPKRESGVETLVSRSVPSPGTTIDHLTRELQHSLDISSALKGRYVVKPQDGGEGGLSGGRAVGGGHSSTYPLGGAAGAMERERRRSAGDERGLLGTGGAAGHGPRLSAHHSYLRTRTDSGKPLSDLEILEQVTVLNLDTGERVPLSIAEDKLPQCINPLSLHIMRLTSEYVSNTSLEKERESDADSVDSKQSSATASSQPSALRHTTSQLIKKFLGTTVKKTMIKAKTIGQRQKGEEGLEVEPAGGAGLPAGLALSGGLGTATDQQFIKLKASNSHKGPYDFDCLQHVQELSGEHTGPVWCMKFSSCGRLLATAGQDRVLRIWVLNSAYPYFQEIRTKYNCEKVSPTPSQESLVSQLSSRDVSACEGEPSSEGELFLPRPFCTYWGHTSDLLDISWSKNYFILSSSMDKTVRLWHISRKECLCCFQHIEFVTAIVFHPRDDRYFLSGSLDGKLRLWNIPDKKVAVWNELDGPTKLITAANFCQNGKFAVVGSYDGRCIFFTTDQLKYHTTIHVRSSRGKNRTGRKISGIEPMPGEDKILVTSNDSRIRLYDLRDLSLSCKYRGYVNMSSQIRASFSHDGKYIVSGSENQCIYIWKSNHDYGKFTSARRDRNDYWEGVKAHSAVVTCAVFSPQPLGKQEEGAAGYLLVSADYAGGVKVFVNRTRPRHSSLPASALA